MALKTIKNVDDETWHRFKVLSVKNHIPMGKLLKKMIANYESESQEFWKTVLSGEQILSSEDIKEMKKDIAWIREEKGYRT